MQRNSINGVLIISGTAAERATLAANIAGKGTEFWESDGTSNKYRSNGTSWTKFESNGASLVTPADGVSFGGGVPGAVTSAVLQATNSPASTAGQYVDNELAKAFDFNVGSVIPAGDALLIGWSTTANDEAAVAANLASLATVWGTPAYTMVPNCIAVPEGSPGLYGAEWDGTTTIKTIAIRLVSGAGPIKIPLAVRT